jgi:hypothetical protein
MEKFAVNYNDLQGELSPKPQVFRYEDVKDRLKKVAYDVVRFVDGDDISGLWQIQETKDGEVIVAKYDDTSELQVEKVASVETHWRVLADKSGEHIHVFYKDSPVTKVSLASVGIPTEDADVVCRYLPEKLATNEALTSNLLAEMPRASVEELVKAHPELSSMAGVTPGSEDPEAKELPCGCPSDCKPCARGNATKGNCLCK